MDESAKKAHAHSSGFIWGLLIGGGLMYLLSTPNGRRILKEISENGIESIHEVVDMEKFHELKDALGDFEFDEEEFEEVEQNARIEVSTSSPKKRLFRGIRKR